jgi:sarcosine oxidase, subunit beta
MDRALAQAAGVYPALDGAELVAVDASSDEACLPDGIPIIDHIPGTRNAYLAANWSAHGFALFPAVVEAMTRWLLTGDRPAILMPFTCDRFPRSAAPSN